MTMISVNLPDTEQHAFLAPSSADRWSYCTGSAWMESQFPDLADDEARRLGTAAHWVFQHDLACTPLALDALTPNGVPVTKQMLEGSELLLADIEAKLRPYFGDKWREACMVEKRVAIPLVHPTHNWGTPDVRAWVMTPDGRWRLFIWDYKFGFRGVEVFENKQLINYVAGCITEGKALLSGFSSDSTDVVLSVVQPRAYHADGPVRTWETTMLQLQPYIHSLTMAADEATGDAPLCRPRPDGCRDCRARSGCKALQDAVYAGMAMSEQAIPLVMSEDAMGLELALVTDAIKLMEARASGLEETVKARIRAGIRVPHWMYGPGQGATVWTVPDAEVVILGQMFDLPLAKPPQAITPIQAKTAGLRPELLETYSRTVSGATKLMRDDGSNVRRIFSIAPVPK